MFETVAELRLVQEEESPVSAKNQVAYVITLACSNAYLTSCHHHPLPSRGEGVRRGYRLPLEPAASEFVRQCLPTWVSSLRTVAPPDRTRPLRRL